MLPKSGKPALCKRRLASVAGFVVLALATAGCAGSVAPRSNTASANAASEQDARARHSSVPHLRDALLALGQTVSPAEAAQLSERAHTAARQLAYDYRAVGSPHFQNFLVNAGFKKRGLCFHWTEDLMCQLKALHLTTLQLHWADARAGTLREHNCVVVTAGGQPFAQGIVLDAWRHSGRLFWSPVRVDHYPWKEDDTDYMRRIANRSLEKEAAQNSALSSD